jgi:hypothetical protein
MVKGVTVVVAANVGKPSRSFLDAAVQLLAK